MQITIIQVVAGDCGEYDVVYSLPKEGRYRMWVRVLGQDVKGSPFQVYISQIEQINNLLQLSRRSHVLKKKIEPVRADLIQILFHVRDTG